MQRNATGSFQSAFPSPDEEAPEFNYGANTAGPGMAGTAFSWAWNYFTNRNNEPKNAEEQARARQDAEQAQFGDVFEEMLREEGLGPDSAEAEGTQGGGGPLAKFWSMVGGLSGGALGFIVANVPGMVAGAVAGNRLGAIRDTRGKSVYSVFQVRGFFFFFSFLVEKESVVFVCMLIAVTGITTGRSCKAAESVGGQGVFACCRHLKESEM